MTATIRIDAPRAVELLRAVVDEHGRETVYASPKRSGDCVYVYAGTCSCLVGYALHRAGLTIEQLQALDHNVSSSAIDEVDLPAGVELTEAAAAVFATAQKMQDAEASWGAALDKAAAVAGDWGDES